MPCVSLQKMEIGRHRKDGIDFSSKRYGSEGNKGCAHRTNLTRLGSKFKATKETNETVYRAIFRIKVLRPRLCLKNGYEGTKNSDRKTNHTRSLLIGQNGDARDVVVVGDVGTVHRLHLRATVLHREVVMST